MESMYQSLIELISDNAVPGIALTVYGYQSLIELISDSRPAALTIDLTLYQSLIELISDKGKKNVQENLNIVSISYRVNF